MNIHRLTVIASLILAGIMLTVSLAFEADFIFLGIKSSTFQNICISLMTGAFITCFISFVAYKHEKHVFFTDLYRKLFSIYQNLHTLHLCNRILISKIETEFSITDLSVNNLSIGSDLANESAKSIDVYVFRAITMRKNTTYNYLQKLSLFLKKIWRIHSLVQNLTNTHLEYKLLLAKKENYILENQLAQNTAGISNEQLCSAPIDTCLFDANILAEKIIIGELCGQLDGYTDGTISELEANIIGLYNIYSLDMSWPAVKQYIEQQLELTASAFNRQRR